MDLYNRNTASILTDKDTALKQTFSIDLNNHFINNEFDIIIFDQEDNSGFDCYEKAVQNLNWDKMNPAHETACAAYVSARP